jgi:signal peptidase
VLREVAVGALIILCVLGLLWGLTGQPLNRSAVRVVTTGSMMHCTNGVGTALGRDCDDPNFGRLGTIDPGDMFLLVHVSKPDDVATLVGGGAHHYGKSGDVVVYQPDGNPGRTPVIHRALFYLQMNTDGTFSVPALGLDHVDSLDQPAVRSLGLAAGYADTMRDSRLDAVCGPAGPARSGFITRGDNNLQADQALHSPIATCPARIDWVLGKARGEIPWVGLIRLWAGDLVSGSRDFHNAAGDTKFCMVLTVGALIGGPYLVEVVRKRRRGGGAAP